MTKTGTNVVVMVEKMTATMVSTFLAFVSIVGYSAHTYS